MTEQIIFAELGDVEIGDQILHHSGRFVEVVDIHDQGEEELYRVTFSDESYLDVSLDHRFKVKIGDMKSEHRSAIDESVTSAFEINEGEARRLEELALYWDDQRIPAYGNSPTAYVRNGDEIRDANEWFPYRDPSNDGEFFIETTRATMALQGIPAGLVALNILYGEPKNKVKPTPTGRLVVPSVALDKVTAYLRAMNVDFAVPRSEQGPRTSVVAIKGSVANNLKLAWGLLGEWNDILEETAVMSMDRWDVIKSHIGTILSQTGSIRGTRLRELGIDAPKSALLASGSFTWKPLPLDTRFLEEDWDAGENYLYGFMLVNGNQIGTSPKNWWAGGLSRQLEGEFLRRGLRFSYSRTKTASALTITTRVARDAYATCEEFISGFAPSDKTEVIRGILAGSTVVSRDGVVSAYVRNVPGAIDWLAPLGIEPVVVQDSLRYDGVPEGFYDVAFDVSLSTKGPHKLYDGEGRAVASLPWIFDNCDTGTIARSQTLPEIDFAPTATVVTPTITHRGGKTFVRASMPIDLYPIAEVLRAVAKVRLKRNEAREDPRERAEWSNLTTEDLIGVLDWVADKKAQGNRGVEGEERSGDLNAVWPVIPRNEPFEYNADIGPDDLPIHPYVLGCWLGDGNTVDGKIGGADPEMFDYIEGLGYETRRDIRNKQKPEHKDFWDVTVFKGGKSLRVLLTESGLPSSGAITRMDTESRKAVKHIPAEYHFANIEARMELLRGLMDTDGTHSGIINSSYPRLAEDIVTLARGLGMIVTSKPKVETKSIMGGPVKEYRNNCIYIHTTKRIFNLSRKNIKRNTLKKGGAPQKEGYVSIRRIEKLPGKHKSRCITVDNEDHSFVAGNGFNTSRQSVVLHNQLCQLMRNNSPSDLQIKIIEPKVGTQIFENADSVTGYVDSWFPREGELFEASLDLLRDLTTEMIRRNKIMRLHPGKPEKLAEAREIALREGPQPDGSPHPMWLPYIICYIEECAMLFAPSPNKDDREVQAEILYYVTKLAREARSAGIHLTLATQYPTNVSLPSVIRQQCRRLGLKTQDQIASMVIINEPGLENLIYKGTGKLAIDGRYRDFKGFLLEHEEDNNDVFNTLDKIGTNGGLFSSAMNTTSDGFIEVPPIEASLFAEWDGGSLGAAIKGVYDTGRKTRDIDADIMVPDSAFPIVDDDALRKAIKSTYKL